VLDDYHLVDSVEVNAITERLAGQMPPRPHLVFSTRTTPTWEAYAAFAEDEQGTLSPGKWADMVVLADDPFAAGVERMGEIRILQTVIRGAIEFEQ